MPLNLKTLNENILAYSGKKILDLGCGRGRYYELLTPKGFDYTGIDIDKSLIDEANEIYKTNKFIGHDVTLLLPFLDKSFDTILLIEVIEHIEILEKVKALLKECKRVGRKNIFITTPNCGDSDILKKHGLTYSHFISVATEGTTFTEELSHRHWLKFTKATLSELLNEIFYFFTVEERERIPILNITCFYKLWAEVILNKETVNVDS